MEKRELRMTRDGSHTLYVLSLNEHYHSIHGAIQESETVFIDVGFRAVCPKQTPVSIVEVGFGTGLNALLTVLTARELDQPIHYMAVEPFPLPHSLFRQLNYPQQLSKDAAPLLTQLHELSWEETHQLKTGHTFRKTKNRFEEWNPSDSFDLCYFDAFAPNKQPELWEHPILEKAYQMLAPNSVLVTYCAQGAFKRSLQSVGFHVEALPGPPGKREMTRAWKDNS